jgi:hypothetical protein
MYDHNESYMRGEVSKMGGSLWSEAEELERERGSFTD